MQYKSNTSGVEVLVSPEYVDSQVRNNNSFFVWAYHVEIENKSSETLQLVNRYWKIIDETGVVQEISGLGAVGEQPILAPNDNFKYSSGVHLRHPSGIMSGHYGMKRPNGEIIKVEIPAFSLDVPSLQSVVN
ncbi:MAG: Co2+/Mg2+ efflux protein ApaG [Pseudomonadota bacterium]